MSSMYEQLRSLPLFQGVGAQRISELVERLPFHFLKFSPGETIISAGSPCQHIRFVVSGDVKMVTASAVLKIKIEQTLHAPEVLGAESLFGVVNTYPFTVTAGTGCGILQLRKGDYIKVLLADKVFLFNILNYLSSNSQRHGIALQNMRHDSVRGRLSREILSFTTQRSTDVKLRFRQKDLCSLLGTQRNTLMAALDEMKADGLIEYTRDEISVKSLRELQDNLSGDTK